MSAEWDNLIYYTDDIRFITEISNGNSEPYEGGSYNSHLNVVKRYVKKYPSRTRVMLDVGAHIGTTMLPYSRIFSKVYGFEPNRESYELCLKNIKSNNVEHCYVENCAILNRKTIGITMPHSEYNSGCFYFKEDITNGDSVPTKILDEDERFVDVDFIKIDTEGAELYVIQSAINIITKYKPLIQAEMNGLCEKNFEIPTSTLLDLMTNLGYINIPGTDFFYHNEYQFDN